MHPSRLRPLVVLTLIALGGLALPAHSQGTRSKPSLIVFKDGFTLHGRIERPTTWFTDPASKQSFTIPAPGGYYTVEDGARTIAFSPNHVHDVFPDDPNEARKVVRLTYPSA